MGQSLFLRMLTHTHILLPTLLLCFPFLSNGAPSPQDPNDDVEVLSGGPVSTNDYDYPDSGLPGFGGFGGFGGIPRVRVLLIPRGGQGDSDGHGGIDSLLRGLFGFGSPRQVPQDSAPEDSAPESESECGFMCTVFKDLFNFDGIQEHIDAMKDQENEIDGDFDEDGFAVNNSTHTKKVLPDGSVVHINKTVIADTDENGNSFVIHRSIIHTYEGDIEVDDVEEVEDAEEDAEEDVEEDAESVETFMKEDSATGVDDGLKQ